MSHMPDFFPLFRPRPSFSPSSSYSFSIYNTINPNRRPYRIAAVTLPIQYYIITNQSSIPSSPYKENKMRKSPLPRPPAQPLRSQSIPEPWINYLTCKVIKLFNSNNLIQTFFFSFLSYLSYLFLFHFSFYILHYTTHLKR